MNSARMGIPPKGTRRMARAGRKRTPAGKVALPPNITPEMIEKVPPAPERYNAEQVVMWHMLHAYGQEWTEAADALIIGQACDVSKRLEDVRRAIDLDTVPLWYATNGRQVISHPAVVQERELRKELREILGLLGFTPTDRARMGLEKEQAISAALENNIKAKHEREQERRKAQAAARRAAAAAALAKEDSDGAF